MSSSTSACQLCLVKKGIYVCPQCNILYCSVDCYKTEKHIQCSEPFYEKCVKEELAVREKDPEATKRMLAALLQPDEGDENLDSDDEDPNDLVERLQGTNLDDPEDVWSKLSTQEKKEFNSFVKSGKIIDVLPEWEPWWKIKKKKVEEVGKPSQDVRRPPIPDKIPPLSDLTKMMPSHNVGYMLHNVLLAYVFTAKYFKGQQRQAAVESATTILALSDSLSCGKVFDSPVISFMAFDNNLEKVNWIKKTSNDRLSACDDVAKLLTIQGTDFVLVKVALSDLDSLIQDAVVSLKQSKTKEQRFCGKPPTIKELKIAGKKVCYYLSWVNDYWKQMLQIVSNEICQ